MHWRRLPTLAISLAVIIVGAPALAADDADEAPAPVSTSDPAIPTDELELLLKPLTKDQLLTEAEAWREMVEAKAKEIARAEIAIKRQNQEIAAAAAIENKAARAKEELEQVEAKARQASGEAVGESVDKARTATEDAAKATEAVEAKAAQAADAVEAGAAGASMGETAEAMAQAKAAKKDEKVALLEKVAKLREERTVLLDHLKAVITALEAKTPDGDADTLAKIEGYKLYVSAVSGITLDVKDTTSAWLAIKGWLVSDEGGIRWAINLAKFVAILVVAWIIAGIVSALIHRAMKRVPGTSRLLEAFLVRAARWVVLAIGLIMALAALEVSIAPLLAVVGAAGFVIAFALQDSLGNFASGLMILFFKPFDVGDVVDAGGVSGTVDSMNLVSTTIKTFDNKRMVVPNNKVWGDVITNASGVAERRVDMEFGIGYDDDIDRAQVILEEIVGHHPLVLTEPAPTIRMAALADSSVNFIVRPWAKTKDYWQVFWDVTREVKKRFDAEDIGIPFPQRDVHLYLEGAQGQAVLKQIAGGSGPELSRNDGTRRDDGGPDN